MSPKEEGTPQKAASRDLAQERVAESTQKRELRAMGCCTAATAKEGWLDVREHLRESFPVRGARATSDNMFCVHLGTSVRAVIIEELNFLNWEICEFCIKIRRRSVTI